jgi:hypothetical protein
MKTRAISLHLIARLLVSAGMLLAAGCAYTNSSNPTDLQGEVDETAGKHIPEARDPTHHNVF